MEAVRVTGLPHAAAAAEVEPRGLAWQVDRLSSPGTTWATVGIHHQRARALAAGLVLSHRLRARHGPGPQAGLREQAARVIGLTARLWLGSARLPENPNKPKHAPEP